MKTGYTIRIEQHDQVRELTEKLQALGEGQCPRVRVAALCHQLAIAVEDLAQRTLPEPIMEQLGLVFINHATGIARQINPLSVDH